MLLKISVACAGLLMLVSVSVWIRYVSWRESAMERLTATSTVAETRVGPIEYVLIGDATAPVLLYVHGAPGGFDQHVDPPAGYRLLAPSRPGYLRTPIDVGEEVEAQADAYAALLDSLEIESVVIMGASGGGPSAIAFAARHPERTRALIAMSAVSQSASIPQVPAMLRGDFSCWLVLSTIELLGGGSGLAKLLVTDEDSRRRLLAEPGNARRLSAAVWSLWPPSRRMAGWHNDAEQFADLEVVNQDVRSPVLIIHGSADTSVSPASARALAARVPHAELHMIEGAGHMVAFTHANAVAEALGRFLAGGPHTRRPPDGA